MNKQRLMLFSCLAAVAFAYAGALDNYLVADSWVFMLPRSFASNFGYFFRTMLPPEHNALWLRPVPMFFYWLDTVLWPGTNWGPHLINIIFHLLNVWLVWRVVRLMRTDSKGTAVSTELPEIAVCLLYGLHPLNVGAVAWVAARFDVMSVTFGLAGLGFWISWLKGGQGRRTLVMAIAFLVLAIFSKEQGVVYAAACFCTALLTIKAGRGEKRKRITAGTVCLAVSIAAYILFRIIVFRGLGGYLEARNGLSLMPPVNYFAAVLFPFGNVMNGAGFSVTVIAASLFVFAAVYLLYKSGNSTSQLVRPGADMLVLALAVAVFGLLTNMPNPGLTADRIMGHAESRFAINAVTGFALAFGWLMAAIGGRKEWFAPAVSVLALLAAVFVWRSDVQVQAWDDAGQRARLIVEDTLRIAPNPSAGCTVFFIDIPRNNEQWAYIFGIGLKEALQLAYERDDITFVRYPKKTDLQNADPVRDIVLRYNKANGQLERPQGTANVRY